MDKVTGVLFKMLGKTKIQEDRFHLEQLRQTWPEIVGKVVASHSVPDRLSRKRLTLRVNNSGWSQELYLQKTLLLEKINGALGGEVVKDLLFAAGGRYPKVLKKVSTAKQETQIELTEAEQKEALAACPVLTDAALAAQAREFFLGRARQQKRWRQEGVKQCSRCGAFLTGDGELCPFCKRELEQAERTKLARLLSKQPWLSEAEAGQQTGCSTYLYISVKESLKSFYNLKVRQENATEAEKNLAVCLTYSRPPEKITAQDYENALKAIRGKKQHVFSTRK